MTAVDAPFLGQYTIYRIDHAAAPHRRVFFLGFCPDLPVFFLTGDPQTFARMAALDGVRLASSADAERYLSVLIVTTRDMSGLCYLVSSTDDVLLLSTMTQPAAVRSQLRPLIAPVHAESVGDGFAVTASAMWQQTLERRRYVLAVDGGLISSTVETLATDLPTVFGV